MTKVLSDTERVKELKRFFLKNACKNGVGHLVSSLSALEILFVLYNKVANITKENARAPLRDRIVISKEHCRYAQACVLYEKGLISKSVMTSYMKNGGFMGHDMYNIVGPEKIAAVDIASGSLGHGLGVGAGLALADKDHNIYVVVGDAELQEGSCWEAIMFIGHNCLKNVVMIVDRNQMQIDDYTKNIIRTSDFCPQALEAFDWDVIECDGHDVESLEKALRKPTNKPKCVVGNTIKGKELYFLRDKYGMAPSHWMGIDDTELEKALQEVN